MADGNTDLYARRAPHGWLEILLLPVVLAALMLLGVNAVLLWQKPLAAVDPESLPAAHTWVWWATKEFQEMKPAPSVVLLGSSLVMHPVSRMDADFVGHDIDYVKHHRSLYMDERIAKTLAVPNCSVYNFSLPGGMVSDDYMVARALFKGDRKPAVIVLGLSIRDFIDSGVHCVGATPAFKYLKRYTNIDDLVDISMPQVFQRSDYWLGNGIYLWGKKLDIQVMLAEKTRQLLGPFYARTCAKSQLAAADTERNQPSNLRAEVEEGMMIVKHHWPYSWEDNSKEYKKRYRSPNEKMAATQFWFLKQLCRLADKDGIRVVIVNMPLTAQNHQLMPAGAYEKYLAELQATARTHNCSFINLDASGKFDLKDYYDTAHMNASGGRKFIDLLVAQFARDESIVAALRSVSRDRAIAARGRSY
jgi:hypothetical protein